MNYIKNFKNSTLTDLSAVGGKAASLGFMIQELSSLNVRIPHGFAITSKAYWEYVHYNQLMPAIQSLMNSLGDHSNMQELQRVGSSIRNLFEKGVIPPAVTDEISLAYKQLCKEYKKPILSVAVRSSATAEDLPNASFAGQQESYLNIKGTTQLLNACKQCWASLFTDRAIAYRIEKGFDYKVIALSIAVQKMVRSDKGVAGVAFSLDTESGFKDAIIINASYGLGQAIVQGSIIPDEYIVFKPFLNNKTLKPILKKKIGSKTQKIIYAKQGITTIAVKKSLQKQYCLSDQEIIELANTIALIETHYSQKKGFWCPLDIEWAKDGNDGLLYIVQARPETIHSQQKNIMTVYQLEHQRPALLTGQSIGNKIVSGKARVISDLKDSHYLQSDEIVITNMTDPDWVPVLKKAAGIITQAGGRTCHAAIVARELGIPALVGALDAMKNIKSGTMITLDCSQGQTGYVYEGMIPFTSSTIALDTIPKAPIDIMINCADPDRAFSLSFLPAHGVGLARLEFIIANTIKIHPLALVYPGEITDKKIIKKIEKIIGTYSSTKDFYIDMLAQGIAQIAAAFYPKPVIVRFSDFKTNEYNNLLGGSFFEPREENPMIGFRGAIRYYSDRYKQAFALECAAIKKVREEMGLTNVQVMVPFVRTVEEGKKVIQEINNHGLYQEDGLKIIMMCEVPSNVLLIDEFLKYFDGISIGSNDLTQLTLGVDRDSGLLNGIFDERNEAIKKMFALAIIGAKKAGKYSGICGQAPSDYPELADYLISLGIESISLNADSVIPFLLRTK